MSWLERQELKLWKQLRKPILFDFCEFSDETIKEVSNIPTEATKDFDFTNTEIKQ